MNKILSRIDQICDKKRISKYRLAKNTGLPYSTIMNSFRSDTMPTISTLEKICKGLDITMAQFFSNDNDVADLTTEQKYVLTLFSELSNEKKELAKAYIEGLSERRIGYK